MVSFRKKILKALFTLLLLSLLVTIILNSPWGQPVLKTILSIPEVVPNFPFKPLKFVSKQPLVEEVEIPTERGKISFEIYRPDDFKKHPAVIVMVTGTEPTSELAVEYTKSFARLGYVAVIPHFSDVYKLDKVSLKTEQVNGLVDIFQAVSKKEFVDSEKMGFVGICAGGSLVLDAAENPLISSKVKSIVAISAYFDGFTAYKQIYLKTIEEAGKVYPWKPNINTVMTTDRLLINTLANVEERQILENFIEGKSIEKPNDLSTESWAIYNFITNSKAENFVQLWDEFPNQTKKVIAGLSPITKIGNLKAHVFILSDNKDTYIPHTESVDLAKSLPSSQRDYVELDLLEHSRLSRRLPRLKSVVEIAKVFYLGYKMFASMR